MSGISFKISWHCTLTAAAAVGWAAGKWGWPSSAPADHNRQLPETAATPAPSGPGAPGDSFLAWLDGLDKAAFPDILGARPVPAADPLSALEDHLLLETWVRRDPAACLEWLAAHQPERRQDLLSAAILWLKIAPVEAWSAIARLPPLSPEDGKNDFLKTLCESVLHRDPGVFLQLPPLGWIGEAELLPHRQSAIIRLAWKDPVLAIARRAELMPDDTLILSNITRIWAQNDPAGALAWSLKQENDPTLALDMQRAALAGVAKKDPEAAITFLESHPDLLRSPVNDQHDFRAAIAAKLAETSVKRSLEWLGRHFSPADQEILVRGILTNLADDFSQWVPEFVSGVPDSALRLKLLESALRHGWRMPGSIVEGTLMDKLQDIPASPEWRITTRAVAETFMSQNTPGAVREKIESLHGPIRTALILALAQQRTGPFDSAAYAGTLAENPAWLTPAEVTGIFKASTASGAALLNKIGYVEKAYAEAATVWAAQDPAAAAAWIASLPDERARREAAEPLISAWARTDEYAASQWIAALPAGPAKDEAAASLATGLISTSPAEAWTWLMSIPDAAAARLDLVRRAADAWLKADPEAAKARIGVADLPAEIRGRLLENAGGG